MTICTRCLIIFYQRKFPLKVEYFIHVSYSGSSVIVWYARHKRGHVSLSMARNYRDLLRVYTTQCTSIHDVTTSGALRNAGEPWWDDNTLLLGQIEDTKWYLVRFYYTSKSTYIVQISVLPSRTTIIVFKSCGSWRDYYFEPSCITRYIYVWCFY